MADSDAIRAKRYRRHAAGDHSLCSHGVTDDASTVTPDPDTIVYSSGHEGGSTPEFDEGSALAAVKAFLREVTVTMAPSDPRLALATVAAKLAAAFDRRPSAALGRELRESLELIGAHPVEVPDVVDELQARRAMRRVDELISAAFSAKDDA